MVPRKFLYSLILFCAAVSCRAQGPLSTDSFYFVRSIWPTSSNYSVWTVPSITTSFGLAWPDGTGGMNYVLTTDGGTPTGTLTWNSIASLLGNGWIKNQNTLQTSANFDIDGNGEIHTNLEVHGAVFLPGYSQGVAYVDASSTLNTTAALSAGETILGGATGDPTAAFIGAGPGITIAYGAGSMTISATVDSLLPDSVHYIQNQNTKLQGTPGAWRITGSTYTGENDTVVGHIFGKSDIKIGDGTLTGTNAGLIGSANKASGDYSFVTGQTSAATGKWAVAMGGGDSANANNAFSGGGANSSDGEGSTTFGENNYASSLGSTAIGEYDSAEGTYSVALGGYASTHGHGGSFCFSDGSINPTETKNDADDQFLARFTGGYKLFANSGSTPDLLLDNSLGLQINDQVYTHSSAGSSGMGFISGGSGTAPSWSFKPVIYASADVDITNVGVVTTNASYNCSISVPNPLNLGVSTMTVTGGNPAHILAVEVTPHAGGGPTSFTGEWQLVAGVITIYTWQAATTTLAFNGYSVLVEGY